MGQFGESKPGTLLHFASGFRLPAASFAEFLDAPKFQPVQPNRRCGNCEPVNVAQVNQKKTALVFQLFIRCLGGGLAADFSGRHDAASAADPCAQPTLKVADII